MTCFIKSSVILYGGRNPEYKSARKSDSDLVILIIAFEGLSACVYTNKLVHNAARVLNFELPLLIRNSTYLAQILCGLSYKI